MLEKHLHTIVTVVEMQLILCLREGQFMLCLLREGFMNCIMLKEKVVYVFCGSRESF